MWCQTIGARQFHSPSTPNASAKMGLSHFNSIDGFMIDVRALSQYIFLIGFFFDGLYQIVFTQFE